MKLNGNQPSAAETMKSIDNNHLLQIQEIKIDLRKSGEQEKYSEHDVNKVLHVKRVSRQYPPVNRYLVCCYMSFVRDRKPAHYNWILLCRDLPVIIFW